MLKPKLSRDGKRVLKVLQDQYGMSEEAAIKLMPSIDLMLQHQAQAVSLQQQVANLQRQVAKSQRERKLFEVALSEIEAKMREEF